jgi:hypothetical protein
MKKPLIRNGYIEAPDLPGLGIDDLDDEVIREHVAPWNPGIWAPTDEWTYEVSCDITN